MNALYWITDKPAEDTEEAFAEAVMNGAKFGFPVTAIKQAAQSTLYRLGAISNQMVMRGAFFIEGDDDGMVQIHSDIPTMREDMVKIGMGTADIRYRAQFNNWYADLNVSYNASGDISLSNIINAIEAGGYVCGLGQWRPERDGRNGMFHIEHT